MERVNVITAAFSPKTPKRNSISYLLTFAFVLEIGEVNHLLREDVQAKSSTSVRFVIDVSRIGHNSFAFIHDNPEKSVHGHKFGALTYSYYI